MTEPEHSTKKLGMMFTLGGWILGFLLLGLFFTEILDRRHNPNQSVASANGNGYQQIELQRNPYGHYLFDGEINHKSVTFLVDTGATTISIPASLASYLQLQTGAPFTVTTANGLATAYTTELNQLKMGPIELNGVKASLNPGMTGNEILLGMNVLRRMEIIQREDKMVIRQYN